MRGLTSSQKQLAIIDVACIYPIGPRTVADDEAGDM